MLESLAGLDVTWPLRSWLQEGNEHDEGALAR